MDTYHSHRLFLDQTLRICKSVGRRISSDGGDDEYEDRKAATYELKDQFLKRGRSSTHQLLIESTTMRLSRVISWKESCCRTSLVASTIAECCGDRQFMIGQQNILVAESKCCNRRKNDSIISFFIVFHINSHFMSSQSSSPPSPVPPLAHGFTNPKRLT